jgi:hypothetical protein
VVNRSVKGARSGTESKLVGVHSSSLHRVFDTFGPREVDGGVAPFDGVTDQPGLQMARCLRRLATAAEEPGGGQSATGRCRHSRRSNPG